MSNKTIIIYKSPILFEILQEIKERLNFELLNINNNLRIEEFSKFKDFIIISDKENKIKNCNIISIPERLDKILEQINIWFLSSKFLKQSKIKIGKYLLNLNSREICHKDIKVNLTEKEVELLVFIISNNFSSLKNLQKNIWKHQSELETHTVETHIYRLRKKFSDKFKDDKFIKTNKQGYHINQN